MSVNPDSPQNNQLACTPCAVPAGDVHDKHADSASEKFYKASDETRNDTGKQHPVSSYAS